MKRALGLLVLLGCHRAAQAGLLEDLESATRPVASRFNFSGVGEARFTDGGPEITPHNVNNQGATGGISTFSPLNLHLFLDVDLGEGSNLFIKTSGGSDDASRMQLDALAIGVDLLDGGPRLEAGRFLNNFGHFPTRFLPQDNPLPGLPLIHSYRVALRPDQIPSSADDLLSQRGRGQASVFTGFAGAASGLRHVSNEWYLNGIKLIQNVSDLTFSAAVHNEIAGNFDFVDPNDSKTVTLHTRWQPQPGFAVGASASRGAYLSPTVQTHPSYLGLNVDDFHQTLYGLDMDYARGHFRFFAEVIAGDWETPNVAEDLGVVGFFVEPTLRLNPRWDITARADVLEFDEIEGTAGPLPWELDVRRLEIGLTYMLQRDVKARASHQWNHTEGVAAGEPRDDVTQAQIVASF